MNDKRAIIRAVSERTSLAIPARLAVYASKRIVPADCENRSVRQCNARLLSMSTLSPLRKAQATGLCGMLLREPVGETGIERERDLMLIVGVGEPCGFLRIGQKSAFRHDHRMLAEPAEKEFLAAALDLALILRLEQRPELRLHGLRKAFGFGIGRGVEHLRAAVSGVGKLVLMNRNADGVFRCIQDFEPVVHIGAFLVCDAFDACIMNGAVGVARDLHLKAGDFEQSAQVKQNVQVDALLRNAVRRGASAVYPAVRRINLN